MIGGKKITGENYRISDYRLSYDSVRASALFSNATKRFLFPLLLERISENFSERDFEKYFKKLKEDVTDSAFILRSEKAYMLEN